MRPFAGLGFRLVATAAAVAAAVGLAPDLAAAQEFELHPAYIEGTVEFGDSVVIQQGNVYANAYDPSTGLSHSASTQLAVAADGHSGTYTLTVEAGTSGLTYSVYSYTYASSYQVTIYTPGVSAAVTEGDTTTVNFSYPGYELGTVHTSVEVTGAGSLMYAYAYFNSVDPDTGITTNSNVSMDATGLADASVGPGNAYAYGNAYVNINGQQTYYPLGYQYFLLANGGELDLGWSLDIDPVDPGSITGTISIDGEYVDVFYIYANGGNPPMSTYTQVYGGGSFTFDPANPGTWSLYAYAYQQTDDGGTSYYQFPYVYVTVAPGEDLTGIDFDLDPAYMEGTLTLGDWRSPSSSSVYVYASGSNGAGSQYYKSLTSGVPETTPYCLFLDPDVSWPSVSLGVSNYYYEGSNSSYNSVSGYIANSGIPDLEAGDTHTQDFDLLDFNASTLTLNLTVAGGGNLSYPQVTASGTYYDEDGNYVYSTYANGSSGQSNVSEGTVTLTLAPGTYDISASAYVNGSWTTFGVLNDYVVEPGDVIEQDLSAPALVITSPAPGSVFECHTDVTVSGTATDPSGVDSVTVNGTEVDVDEDGNFETVLENLDSGTHTVEITATDTLGNSVTIQRTFVIEECDDEDVDAPVVTASPSISCIWPPNHKMVAVTISGSASDASGIAAIQGFTITSNQKDDTKGDGKSTGDCHGKDGYTSPAAFTDSITVDSDGNFSFDVKLRAERQGNGQDRVYTVSFTVVDEFGNSTPVSTTVCVPHNQ